MSGMLQYMFHSMAAWAQEFPRRATRGKTWKSGSGGNTRVCFSTPGSLDFVSLPGSLRRGLRRCRLRGPRVWTRPLRNQVQQGEHRQPLPNVRTGLLLQMDHHLLNRLRAGMHPWMLSWVHQRGGTQRVVGMETMSQGGARTQNSPRGRAGTRGRKVAGSSASFAGGH